MKSLPFILVCLVLFACNQETRNEPIREDAPTTPTLLEVYSNTNGQTEVHQRISSKTLRTSDRLIVELEILAPAEHGPEFLNLAEQFAPFTFASREDHPVQLEADGRSRYRVQWTLFPPLPGKTALFPLTFSVGSQSVMTQPVILEVLSVLPPGTQDASFRPLAAPLGARDMVPSSSQISQWIIGGLLLAGGLALGLWGVRRVFLHFRPLLPHERALRDLDMLEILKPSPDVLHQLSLVLRRYLEDGQQFPALAKTTQELQSCRQHEDIIALLSRCDAARFTHRIEKSFYAQSLRDVREYVLATQPVEKGDSS